MASKTLDFLKYVGDHPEDFREKDLLLILDFDGTIAKIRDYAHEPEVEEGMRDGIAALASSKGVEVAILSGRPLSFLKDRVNIREVRLIPERGIYLHPGIAEKLGDIRAELEAVKGILKPYVEAFRGSYIEEKPTSIVYHVRNVKGVDKLGLLSKAIGEFESGLGDESLVEVVSGRLMIEFMPKDMPDKKYAVEDLADGFAGQTVFIGDDASDEPGFEALRGNGFGVLVVSDEKDFETTNAGYHLFGVEGVEKCLNAFASLRGLK